MKLIHLVFTFVFLVSCSEAELKLHTLKGNAFGTTYGIQYFSTDGFDAEKGIDSVFYAVNKSVSTYMPESDISKINRGDSTLVVDQIFKDVFILSEKIFKQSEGFFDPTVGTLRNAYGFGDVKPLQRMNQATLDSLMQFVGFQKVSLTSEGTIKKTHPEIYLDFNAIAKGYGIDCIGSYLEKQGVDHYLIELGGEVLAQGEQIEKQKPWMAGVESPDSRLDDRTSLLAISLKNQALASSGNYRKFRVDSLSGRKLVHTINPLTGLAEEVDITSASVLAPNCAMADAYATTFMALGVQKAILLLNELEDIEAYFTYENAKGDQREFKSSGFKN